MPNVECFRIDKEAQAVFEQPLNVQEARRTRKWHRGYTVAERKHFLSRLLLHPYDTYPVPLRIRRTTIEDALIIEDFCFKDASSWCRYQARMTEGMQRLWHRDFTINFPRASVVRRCELQH